MRGGTLHRPLDVRPSRSLVVRAGLARTFGSLAGFLVVSFLCWGIYILADAFANPINAGAAAVIYAACIIAAGVILLFFLVRPTMRTRTRSRDAIADSTATAAQPCCTSPAKAASRTGVRNDLAYQRFYVDHSRIRQ
jgi:hypothetical protein